MTEQEERRIQQMLKQSIAPVRNSETELQRDLWPAMLNRLEARPEKVPWFDWALAAGVLVLIALSPGAIPVLLFHL